MRNKEAMKFMVTDAQNRVALAVVRALASRDRKVTVVEQKCYARSLPLAARSRFAHSFQTISNHQNEESCIRDIIHLFGKEGALIPVSTNSVITVSKHMRRLIGSGIRVAVPEMELLSRVNDKYTVLASATDAGVCVPRTVTISSLDTLEQCMSDFGFPFVLKLRDDAGLYLDPIDRYRIIRTRKTAEHDARTLLQSKKDLVAQEYIDGVGMGYSAVCWDGRILAEMCHRRIREYPVTGGPSTICETVREPAMRKAGRDLLESLHWHGPAMVEFKKEKKSGRFVLMEINPRFAGSLPLAAFAGLDMVQVLAHSLEHDRAVFSTKVARPGARLRFIMHDLFSVFSSLRSGEKTLAYTGGFLRDLFEMDIGEGLFSFDDMGPGVAYLAQKLSLLP